MEIVKQAARLRCDSHFTSAHDCIEGTPMTFEPVQKLSFICESSSQLCFE